MSPSSWRGLTEQSGFVSEDSCGDGGPALRWGRHRGGGWIWEAEEGRPTPAASPKRVGG